MLGAGGRAVPHDPRLLRHAGDPHAASTFELVAGEAVRRDDLPPPPRLRGLRGRPARALRGRRLRLRRRHRPRARPPRALPRPLRRPRARRRPSYRGTEIYYKSTARRSTEDCLTTFDYCFRYDTECHWLSRTAPPLEWRPVRRARRPLVPRLGEPDPLERPPRAGCSAAARGGPTSWSTSSSPLRRFAEFWRWYERRLRLLAAVDRPVPGRRALPVDRAGARARAWPAS